MDWKEAPTTDFSVAAVSPSAHRGAEAASDIERTAKLVEEWLTNPKIVELLAKHAEFVKANEPGTLKYECVQEVNKKNGLVELIMIER